MLPVYVSGEEFKAMVDLAGLPFEDAAADRAVASASRAIEKAWGRVFYPTPTNALDADDDPGVPEVRRFTPLSRHRVRIDDLLEVTEVAIGSGSTWLVWPEDDYELGPANAAAHGEPYVELTPVGGCWLPELVRSSVRVTGRWGWEDPPAQVTQAVMILAQRMFERKKAPFGIATWGTVDFALRIARTDPDIGTLSEGLARRAVLA